MLLGITYANHFILTMNPFIDMFSPQEVSSTTITVFETTVRAMTSGGGPSSVPNVLLHPQIPTGDTKVTA